MVRPLTHPALYNTFTYHFVVADSGNRWDLIVTNWTDPQGGIGSFLATNKFLRQSATATNSQD
jgi:spermidine synthase